MFRGPRGGVVAPTPPFWGQQVRYRPINCPQNGAEGSLRFVRSTAAGVRSTAPERLPVIPDKRP